MAFLYTSQTFSAEQKQIAVERLLENALPCRDFYILVVGAVLLAVAGIFSDSVAVLIASMIVAPLAGPILGMGFGLTEGNLRLFLRCFCMLFISLIIAVVGAGILTFFFGHIRIDPVFISFESNLYLATAIAIVSGCIAAYGLLSTKVGGAMTGIGIAVSLMPPLVATGIGLVDAGSFPVVTTLIIFLLNVGGILLGSAVVFKFLQLNSGAVSR